MSATVPTIRDLARRLIALEAARVESSTVPCGSAVRVCDQLRVPLTRLAGVIGFRTLLSRAVALAKAEDGSLDAVQVREDGSLEGFDGTGPGAEPGADGGAAVVAHLLGLLVTFIGEPLTRQLVRDAWPDAATDETDGRAEGQP
jgi:hypothetical protein